MHDALVLSVSVTSYYQTFSALQHLDAIYLCLHVPNLYYMYYVTLIILLLCFVLFQCLHASLYLCHFVYVICFVHVSDVGQKLSGACVVLFYLHTDFK